MVRKALATRHQAMRRLIRNVGARLACAWLVGACCAPAWSEEPPAADPARALVDEVLRKAGNEGGGLDDWSRVVIERALERASKDASDAVEGSGLDTRAGISPAPLPAEPHAERLIGSHRARSKTAEVLVFLSLSVPSESWRVWAREAADAGAPIVLRGVAPGGVRETVAEISDRLGQARAGVAIDPRLFRLFGVESVPAVVAVPGGVPPCRSRGCSGEPAPPHDLVAGNIGLAAALEAIAAEGGPGRQVARRDLEQLRGTTR